MADCLTSLCLYFLFYKMGVTVAPVLWRGLNALIHNAKTSLGPVSGTRALKYCELSLFLALAFQGPGGPGKSLEELQKMSSHLAGPPNCRLGSLRHFHKTRR